MENEKVEIEDTFTMSQLVEAFEAAGVKGPSSDGPIRVFAYQVETERHFKIFGVRKDADGEYIIDLESC